MKTLVSRKVRYEYKLLPKPGRMCQVPFRRTHIYRGLNDIVLRLKRLTDLFRMLTRSFIRVILGTGLFRVIEVRGVFMSRRHRSTCKKIKHLALLSSKQKGFRFVQMKFPMIECIKRMPGSITIPSKMSELLIHAAREQDARFTGQLGRVSIAASYDESFQQEPM